MPKKNLRALAGKPLIAHAIEAALGSELIDRVMVSTDDDEIAAAARQYGAEVPFMRPAELARDDSPEWLAWQHAIRAYAGFQDTPGADAMVSIPTTSPLRSLADVDACVTKLLDSDADIVITVTPSVRNPYFNMVELDRGGCARLAISTPKPISGRQWAPPVFDITTVAYAARPEFVLSASSIFDGKVRAVVVPAERALDIDTELDLEFAEFLLARS